MKRRHFVCSLFLPLLLLGRRQDETAPPKPPKPQFFAGLVVAADAEHVTVSRTLVGRPAETHIFALDPKTKTPKGGIKLKTRVTVRYAQLPERDLALEIQVRR
jgi:hypothetical protein